MLLKEFPITCCVNALSFGCATTSKTSERSHPNRTWNSQSGINGPFATATSNSRIVRCSSAESCEKNLLMENEFTTFVKSLQARHRWRDGVIGPVVQRQRRLGDNQESAGSIPAGITVAEWSEGVSAARLLGKEEGPPLRGGARFNSRTDLSDQHGAAGPMGRRLVCTQATTAARRCPGSIPRRSTGVRRET